ncbi:MAG TPA: hemerythrin domain-containing protein [candidate division Zixibacteria bacterium]|nr:hemerythrin domain-containing protein [candidate division Zixibacteria bacterium]
MAGTISSFLSDDHKRLDALLRKAVSQPGRLDAGAYAAFRAGLLKHIGMEEKILLPAVQQLRGGEPPPMAAKLRLDHGALAALLVPSPTPGIVAALRAILDLHNALEEGPGGLYELCDSLAGGEAGELLDRLRAAPEVSVAPHNDGPGVLEATRRALQRAGYDLDELASRAAP